MNNPIIYQGVGGLLVVFFLVAIYYFTKTWRWHQILAIFSVFVSSIFLLYYTALVYRTHNKWRTLEAKTTAQAEKLAEQVEKLRHGDFAAGEQKEESIISINAKVGRSIIDLGRVWRQCTPQPLAGDGSVTVSTVPPGTAAAPPPEAAPAPAPAAPATPPAAGAAAATPAPAPAAPPRPAGPQPNRIAPRTVLFVFVEDLAPADPDAGLKAGAKVPRYFLGEFLATAATDTTVTLAPVLPLSPVDVALMRSPNLTNLTFSLYETLPVDGHEIFATNPEEGGKLNEPATEFSVFGKMDPKRLEVLFPPPVRNLFEPGPPGDQAYQIATQRYAVMTKNYLRDGLRASNDDPQLNVWLKIRFKEKYSEVVDSGAKVNALALGATDDYFDRGMAEVAMLQRGSKADFKAGDVAVFPQEDGNRLLQEKTADGKPYCELIEPVYVRTLNNYAFLFRDLVFRQNRVLNDIVRLNRDLADIKKTQQHINEQTAVANSEQTKLNADIGKTTYEKTKISEFLTELEKSTNALKAQLSVLYRSNLQLEAEIERANQKLTDDINRRTQAVAGAR